jgi:hypothetical protein
MSHKAELGSSVWVITGNVSATLPKSYKKTLAECLVSQGVPVKGRADKGIWSVEESPSLVSSDWMGGLDINRGKGGGGAGFAILDLIAINSATGEPTDEAFSLRHSSHKQGRGNLAHPNTFVVYKAADGDRIYSENAPTLRSLTNTNGHQGGSGAMKVRELNGEFYYERPMAAAEYENCMGWEPGCTNTGITADGKEIELSETQRKRVLGNGIIPQEITELLTALRPFLKRNQNQPNTSGELTEWVAATARG